MVLFSDIKMQRNCLAFKQENNILLHGNHGLCLALHFNCRMDSGTPGRYQYRQEVKNNLLRRARTIASSMDPEIIKILKEFIPIQEQ
jgi:hypothetical protein